MNTLTSSFSNDKILDDVWISNIFKRDRNSQRSAVEVSGLVGSGLHNSNDRRKKLESLIIVRYVANASERNVGYSNLFSNA